MQLILRPVSNKQLEEIIVTDGRFAIGRNEPYFEGLDRAITAKLSRRHARIFERDGRMYIADLNSSNGTTVNGQVVEGQPVQLKLEDEVQFGGLRYRVEHLGGSDTRVTAEQQDGEAKIVLTPTDGDAPLAPVVLSAFPYVFGRYSDAVARYEDALPDDVSQISKNHAEFFLRGGDLCLQDLGSTNGTFVGGEQLSDQARKLADGDTIRFASSAFAYSVQVFVGQSTVLEAGQEIEKLAEGTIFVDDATNFLEVYMGPDEHEADAQGHGDDPGSGADGADGGQVPARPPGKVRRLFRELRDAGAGGPVDRSLRWTLAASVAALAIGVAGYWYVTWPVRDVDRQMDAGRYALAAETANRYLQSRPNNGQLQGLAVEATLKAFVPDWQDAVARGDRAEAERVLELARQAGSHNPRDDEILSALALAAEISGYSVSEDADRALDTVLAGGESVAALVDEWDSRNTENRRALLNVERNVDGFDRFQTDFYRSLRAMRESTRQAEPYAALRAELSESLAMRDTDEIRDRFQAFQKRHPELDAAMLTEDIARYEAVEQDIEQGKWLLAFERANGRPFRTAPFAAHLDRLNATVLPDAETRAAYEDAARLWAEGNAIESFDILETLSASRWGRDAERRLERNSGLLRLFAELLADPDAADYETRLFGLFGELDPELDAYLHTALRPDFQRYRDAALRQAVDLTGRARTAWSNYTAAGGLQGEHRLEDRVSGQYTGLAELLSAAHENLRESAGIYAQLDAVAPEGWVELNTEVVREIKLQTDIVANLLVIDADVRRAKLDLLPVLPDD